MLEDCSEESIYAPGYIQPHGVLLVLQEPHLKILQVSENVELFFGLSPSALLGEPLQRLFSRSQVKRIATFLRQDNLELGPFLELNVRVPHSSGQASASVDTHIQTFRGSLHRSNGVVLLELEPQAPTEKTHSVQFYHRLQTATLSLRRAVDLPDLAQTLATQVKAIAGFDRVMIYRFEADDHGIVIAEVKEPHLESYLGLHFPAIDIPVPARRLFLHNWVRQIPDVKAASVPLVSGDPNRQPVDLSNCILRGVSPYHTEYLQHMGVAGTLTISLIDDHHLWGLIACHHYSPKRVDYETRKACEFLGQFASVELVHQQEQALNHYRTQIKTIQDRLQYAFLQNPHSIRQILAQNTVELLDLMHAGGMAIALDQHISLVGQTPSLPDVRELLNWLMDLNQPEIYLTHCLVRPYPAARAFKHVASGIMAISIVLHQKSYHLIWFRPEQIQTVSWAGNPQDAVEIDSKGNLSLCPRKSFELWKETVQEMSLPWQPAEIEAARMMHNTLMLAVLEFSQAALEEAAERAAIANRAKSQFLAKMSHELRTPLNAILGFTQIMNRSPHTSAEFQDHLGIINRSGEHLLTLINDVLEMSKIEAGQLTLNETCFNITRLIHSIEEMFALKAIGKRLLLKIEMDPTVPTYVCGDESKIRQILINLLGNAIKFTSEGSVMLRVLACPCCVTSPAGGPLHPVDAPGVARGHQNPIALRFEVEDNGCGIAEAELTSIFEAFMQTGHGRYVQGTGLGLSISRQFARLMGGDITVCSIPNQGSTFTCQVMVNLPQGPEVVEPEVNRQVIGLEPNQPSIRILVAEDVPENRQLMAALLTSVGFEVRVVKDGSEAIAQWQTWQPHLILMDIHMPVIDGHEASRQIRRQEGAEHRTSTPILALTAYAFDEDRAASLEAGCSDHIAKPFTETRLFEAIAHHVGVRYQYREVGQDASAVPQKVLSPQDLRMMPSDWISHVHEAALDLNDGRLRQLMSQIPDQETVLIQMLTSLIDDFQLEAIATLTEV